MPSDYFEKIKTGLSAKLTPPELAERIYLSYPPIGFSEDWDIFHEIRRKVSQVFGTPITSIHVCGSCQLGMSPIRFTPFEKGKSDLDLAIVDADLFAKLLREAKIVTKQFDDLTSFIVRDNGVADHVQFLRNISRSGMLRPDLMPRCPMRTEWFQHFRDISAGYLNLFQRISAGVYLSEYFFAAKQIAAIKKIKEKIDAEV